MEDRRKLGPIIAINSTKKELHSLFVCTLLLLRPVYYGPNDLRVGILDPVVAEPLRA